jgi:hypothetical protein
VAVEHLERAGAAEKHARVKVHLGPPSGFW